MIVVVVAVLAVLSVAATGGSLRRIAALRPAWPATIVAALALQVLIVSVLPDALPGPVAAGLHLASYGLAVAFLWRNRRIPWLWLVGLGGLANLAAIGANAGVMPAPPSALASAGLPPASGFTNSGLVRHAHLAFLGDVFAVPRGWPLANVFSPGDVVLVVGAVLLLHTVGRSEPARALHAARIAARRRAYRRAVLELWS